MRPSTVCADTGEVTESYCEAEEWMEEGWPVRALDRKDRLRPVVGRELVAYL